MTHPGHVADERSSCARSPVLLAAGCDPAAHGYPKLRVLTCSPSRSLSLPTHGLGASLHGLGGRPALRPPPPPPPWPALGEGGWWAGSRHGALLSMTLQILSHLFAPHHPAMQERGGVFGCLNTERWALLMDFQKLSVFAVTVEKIFSSVVLKDK